MSRSELAALEAELRRRRGLRAGLFDRQLEAIEDPARLKSLLTPRRAGKSYTCCADFFLDAQDRPGAQYVYIGLTRPSAERTGYTTAREVARTYGIKVHPQEAKLRLTLENDAQITFIGADQQNWIERLRGVHLRRCYVDEAASYRINLEKFLHEVVEPALMDDLGTLWLVGTPGDLLDGYFYKVTTGKVPGWSNYTWSTADNPHTAQQYKQLCHEKKLLNENIEQDPGFQREYMGRWVEDPQGRVYQLAELIPDYRADDASDHYLLAIDFGYVADAAAYTLARWSEADPDYIVLQSFKRQKQYTNEIAEICHRYMRDFPGLHILGDRAQLQMVDELRDRYGVPIYPTEKTDKYDWIRLYNSDVATGRVKFVEPDCYDLIKEHKELKKLEKTGGRWVEHPQQPNDASDSNLYAYRHCYHHRYVQPEDTPLPGTPAALEREMDEYLQDLSDEMEAAAERDARRSKVTDYI